MDTITRLTYISPVGSSTSQNRGRSSQDRQTLAGGQFLKALVLEAKGANRFLLDIDGSRQTVMSEAELSSGQTLRLQVFRTQPQIELKILSNPLEQLQGRTLTLLGRNIDLAGLLEGLQQPSQAQFTVLSLSSRATLEKFHELQQEGVGGREGGQVLKQLIDSLGLNLEQLLARGDKNSAVVTLKAALLEIAHNFTNAGNIAETTNKLLTTLEIFQLTQLQIGGETQVILPLPLPFIEQGYLTVEQDDKTADQKDNVRPENRFSLHLSVSELGNMQIDFLRNQEGLFIRFRADNQQESDFIESFSEDLKKAITDIPLISLSFSGDAPDPIQDLVQQLVPEGNSMLDTKI